MRFMGLNLCFLMISKIHYKKAVHLLFRLLFSGLFFWYFICAISKKLSAITRAMNGKWVSPLCSLEKLFLPVAWTAAFSSCTVQRDTLASCVAVNVPCASLGGIFCACLFCNLCIYSDRVIPHTPYIPFQCHWKHIANSCPLLQRYSLP